MTSVQPLPAEYIGELLEAAAPGSVEHWEGQTLWVHPSKVADAAQFLRNSPELDFQFLNAISAVDYVDHIEVVYHLTSFSHRHTAVIKTKLLGREELSLPSVFNVWRGADFQEREVWDLMGVRFEGHPNLKRIMLWEGFEGHPLRKDFL